MAGANWIAGVMVCTSEVMMIFCVAAQASEAADVDVKEFRNPMGRDWAKETEP